MVWDLSDWIDADIDYTCNDCGHETELDGAGGAFIKLCCYDYDCECYPSCYSLFPQYDDSGFDGYELPDGTRIQYRCPECSGDVERTPYDDGLGYYDVLLQCTECGERTWE